MIVDLTNEILYKLKQVLVGVEILSPTQYVTPTFPTVTIEEIDNSSYDGTKDSSGYNHSNISIKIEIYTNGSKKMTDSKKIRGQIDSVMSDEYGFSRVSQNVTTNYLDTEVYRYNMTYNGIVDKNRKIYGR